MDVAREDVVFVALSALVIYVALTFLRLAIFLPISSRLGMKKPEVIEKFVIECVKLTWHSVMLAWEITALSTSVLWDASVFPWQSDTTIFWSEGVELTTPIRWLYLVQMGYYVQGLGVYAFISRPELDMIVHHCAALLLILISYAFDWWPVGSAILLIHESADVLLYASKAAHYAEFDLVANVVFVFVAISWFWSRLVNFPRVIWSTAMEAPLHPGRVVGVCLLSVLLVLHFIWFRKIIRILWTAISSGKGCEDDKAVVTVPEESTQIQARESSVSAVSSATLTARTSVASRPALSRKLSSVYLSEEEEVGIVRRFRTSSASEVEKVLRRSRSSFLLSADEANEGQKFGVVPTQAVVTDRKVQ